MKVYSKVCPELRVTKVDVKFRDGVAEVTNQDALAHLRGLGHLGVEVPAETDATEKQGEIVDAVGAEADPVEVPAETVKRKPGRPKKS